MKECPSLKADQNTGVDLNWQPVWLSESPTRDRDTSPLSRFKKQKNKKKLIKKKICSARFKGEEKKTF